MKVRIHYSDGQYSMTLIEVHTEPKLASMEIPEAKWKQYQEFMKFDREWHQYMQELDNEQFAKDKELEKKS